MQKYPVLILHNISETKQLLTNDKYFFFGGYHKAKAIIIINWQLSRICSNQYNYLEFRSILRSC